MKQCTGCNVEKPYDQFSKNRSTSDGYQYQCKSCRHINKSERKAAKREWMNEYKLERGCKRCGHGHEVTKLHFHHLDPLQKDAQPSHMVKDDWSIGKMQGEIDKCIILCKTCHHEEHRVPSFDINGEYIT